MTLTAAKTAQDYKTQEERKADKAKKEKERANDTKTK